MKASRHLTWETLAEQWIWPLPGTRMLQDAKFHSKDLALQTHLLQTDDLMVTISRMRRMPLVSYLPGSIARVAAREGHAHPRAGGRRPAERKSSNVKASTSC